MQVKRFEKYASKKSGTKIRVQRVFGETGVVMVNTLNEQGKPQHGTMRLLFVDSIRRKYQKV